MRVFCLVKCIITGDNVDCNLLKPAIIEGIEYPNPIIVLVNFYTADIFLLKTLSITPPKEDIPDIN